MEEREREIDIRDVFFSVLLKWRWLLLFLLVGALLGGAYSVYKSYTEENAEIEALEKSVAEARKLCDPAQIELAQRAFDVYKDKEESYLLKCQYAKESLYINFDPSNIYTTTVRYYIDNDYVLEYPVIDKYNNIDDIASFYQNNLTTDEICAEIKSAIGKTVDNQYIRELYSVYRSSSTLVISVDSDTEEDSERIADVLAAHVDEITEQANEVYGDVTLTFSNKKCTNSNSSSIADAKLNYSKDISALAIELNGMTASSAKLSDEAADYYNALIDNAALVRKNNYESESEDQKTVFERISKKMCLIFGIGAALVFAAVLCGLYVIDGKVHVMEDMILNNNVTKIGSIFIPEKKKGRIDSWLIRKKHIINDADEVADRTKQIVIAMRELANQKNAHRVTLLCSLMTQEMNSVLKTLKAEAETESLEVDLINGDLSDCESFSQFVSSEAVVVVEQADRSTMRNVENEIASCDSYQKILLGCVLVSNI